MNAAARFLRSRSLVITVVVLVAAMLLSVFIQDRAQSSLGRVVDTNSRGLYDILVLPEGKGGEGQTLKQPDYLSGAGGITNDQLEQIRSLSGIGVAAPVSLVSKVVQDIEFPQLKATDYVGYNENIATYLEQQNIKDATPASEWPEPDSVLSEEPKKYRITAKAVTSDGVEDTVLFETAAEGSLGQAKLQELDVPGGKSLRTVAPEGETGIKFPDPAGGSSHGDFDVTIALPMLPQISETVVAVDPAAEQALLGDAGGFLAPLTEAPSAAGRNAMEVGQEFSSQMTPGLFSEGTESAKIDGHPFAFWSPFVMQYQSAMEAGSLTEDSQVIPLVVRSGTALDLTYSVQIEEIDDAGNKVADVGTVSKALGEEYLPFASTKPFQLRWPGGEDYNNLLGSGGVQVVAGLHQPASWSTDFVSTPEYLAGAANPDGSVEQTVTPQGWVQVNKLPEKTLQWQLEPDQSQREPVNEQSYRTNLDGAGDAAAPLPFVYGTFNANAVRDAAGDVNYLPLGGYDPTPVKLTKDADGKAVDPVELQPGLSGAGLSVQSAGAITDYSGLAAVRGTSAEDAVIDAVRVKVDAGGSWADAAGQIDAAAAAIEKLGLDVQVVAGSAREDASIYVPEYRQDASGAASDLGTVSQSWFRQGAASAVQTSLSQASSVLLMLTLGGAALLTAASTVAFTRARRTEAVTLRAMGWNRPRIRSWFLSELLVGAAGLFVVAIIVNAFSRTLTTLLVSAVVLVIYLAASFISAALLKPHPPAADGLPGATGVPLVDSPLKFAARQLRTNRFNTGAVAVGVGVLGAAAGALVAVVLDLPRAAGSTALGSLALSQVGGVNVALAVLGVVTALVLTLITSRFDLARKREQWDILEAMGWGPGLLLGLRRSEAGILAGMALPLAILGAVGVSLAVAPHAAFRAAIAGVLAVILWFILMTRTRK
ncbi:ABC transporter permease [Arthrobacter sp. Marseille-P9274]|uniref:ABC transporter permease n=1 Tax=Arthrobacter sp. Marseille-P9274 TaxID=2866572 RepID=UPI0021C68D09|nr:ABC transporter permease [Arthrobacter sp. Marseille-P9274]